MKLLPSSLFSRLLFTGTLAVLLIMGLFGSYIAFQQGRSATQDAIQDAQAFTQATAAAISSALIVKKYDVVEQILIQLAKQSRVERIKVIGLQGRVLISLEKEINKQLEIVYGGQTALLKDYSVQVTYDDTHISVIAPIAGATVIAWVKTEHSLAQVQALQQEILTDTVIATLLAIVGTICFMAFSLKKPVAQIKMAAEFAIQLPENNNKRLEIKPNSTELEHLVLSLNQTSTQLYQQNDELKMLHSLVNYSNDPVFIIDPDDDFRMFFANQAACKHFAVSMETLLSYRITDWSVEYDLEGLKMFWGMLKQEKHCFFEALHRKADGSIVPVEISANYLKYRGKEYYAGYFHNISDRKKNEALLNQHRYNLEQEVERQIADIKLAKDEAIKANKTKSEFLANMSHELRTPLHGILSFARLGQKNIEKGDRVKLDKYFQRIDQSGQRLLTLLNDLLDLSKLEAGKLELNLQLNDLKKLIAKCVDELQGSLNEKQLLIHWQDSSCQTEASFDSGGISQVVINLLTNAIKFSEQGQSITISFFEHDLRTDNDQLIPAILCSIKDQGLGIPEDELDMVFDKFIQSSKTKTDAGGTGLGLAICVEIIKAHGGKIWAEDNIEQGAEFKFVIPLRIDGVVEQL